MRRLILALVLECTSSVVWAAIPAATHTTERIYGGAAATTCQWPQTVLVQLSGAVCSGTLVAPQIVVYAAHCGSDVQEIAFGEDLLTQVARQVVPESCHVYPGHAPENGTDFAYCKLSAPITDVPIVPILMGCELDVLKAGKAVTLVGYGLDEASEVGVKHEVTTIQDYLSANKAFVGGDGKDTCNGDSGGPAFVQILPSDDLPGQADGAWRVYGITSYGTTSVCGSGSFESIMSDGVAWIESDSGIDITPCTDADGNWSPTASCGHFPMHPDNPGGTWSNGCSTPDVSGYSSTCGPAYDANSPITVEISPAPGTALNKPFSVDVTTQSSVSAAVSVQVTYDGVPLGSTGNGSFGATSLTAGEHTVLATATDTSGNSRVAQINVDVTQATPATGCAASGTSLALIIPAAFLGTRWRRRRPYLGLIAALVLSACGKPGTGSVAVQSAGQVLSQGTAPPQSSDVGAPPTVVNQVSGTVAGQAFTPNSALYLYSGTQASPTSPLVTNLVVIAANVAGYCDLVQQYADSSAASYYFFQLFDTTANAAVPTDGNFTIVASEAAVPSTPGKYAYVHFQVNDQLCQNALDNAQSDATRGTVVAKTIISTAGAYVVLTFNGLTFGSQADSISGTLTAPGCTPPESTAATTTVCE